VGTRGDRQDPKEGSIPPDPLHPPIRTSRRHRSAGRVDRREPSLASTRPATAWGSFPPDPLLSIEPLVLVVRWGTVLVGVALTFSGSHTTASVVASAFMVGFAIVRTILPPRSEVHSAVGRADLGLEMVVAVGVVLVTGYWQSPFFFCLVVAVVMAGFSQGFVYAIPVAIILALVVAVPSAAAHEVDVGRLTTVGGMELGLVALVVGYARRIFGEAEVRASQVLSRLSRLNEANSLLLQLNKIAQTLPASLDLNETLTSTLEQIHTMVRPDVAAILLWDASLGRWTVGASEGARLAPVLADTDLPEPVGRVAHLAPGHSGAVLVDLTVSGPGLASPSRRAIYAPLVTRSILVGVLAVESQAKDGLSDRDVALLTGLAEQAALAIDNAQWFGRLRTLGAEEERTRIARDLHDRVAQSLAYLAFELDRITTAARNRPVTKELEALRHDVRQVVTEVRDTLYDLRTNVTENHDLVETLLGFLERVESRSGLQVRFEHHVTQRLPLPVEREFWRVAQEAVTNVEHHAKAHHLVVVWEANEKRARLHVVDDGRGFPVGASGRMDSYGLLGMRERADAIGATLEIDSSAGNGTTVRCRLEFR
jgi:signal transduction histidine kinase